LSSGFRINSAKDDAAGLQISNRMTSQINGLNIAVRNANDGISMAQTAEGAMQESTNILQRMRDLSVQAANGSNSTEDRESLNEEVTQLKAELTRISDTTEFGGQKLLDGTAGDGGDGSLQFQVGANANETISFSLDDMDAAALTSGMSINDGSLTSPAATIGTTAASLGDLVVTTDGTANTTSGVADAQALVAALNANTDLSGTASAATSFTIDLSAMAEDTALVIGTKAFNLDANDSGSIVTSGTVFKAADASALATSIVSELGTGYSASGSVITFANNTGADVTLNMAYTNQADDNAAGSGDITLTSLDTDGNSAATATVAKAASSSSTNSVFRGDVDVSGITGGSDTTALTLDGNDIYQAGTSINDIDVSTAASAQSAIDVIDAAIGTIDAKRAELGAVQNRFESTISNLTNISENVSAARSRIRDVDFAQETAKMSQNQILQQAGTTILAQANQLPQAALSLLG
jgi:flagellin